MNTKLILLLALLATSAGAFAAFRSARGSKAPALTDDVKSWENEGGNVPSVPTPAP